MNTEARPAMQTERLKALTDGVLAIVLTILVLGFEVPEHKFGEDALIDFFRELAVPFLAYVVSFGVVAAYWVQHSSIFHYVSVADRRFFWLNLLFLLPLTLLPFFTNLRVAYHREYVVTILYAGANVICGLLLYALWTYAHRRGFLGRISPEVDRSMSRRILLGVGINFLGALLALLDPHLSTPVFLLLPLIYVSHKAVDRAWST